jgi:flagellar biosynthesis protein FlhF
MSEPETKTYRGNSLEELLPKIRDELGPDAVIMRQREGIVGGVGGFFGKKCVEVDVAPPPGVALQQQQHQPQQQAAAPAVPRGAVFDAYDTGSAPGPELPTALELDPAVDVDSALTLDEHSFDLAGEEPETHEGDLMEALLAQASPFADELAQAWGSELFDEPSTDDAAGVRAALAEAGIPSAVVDSVVETAQQRLLPFAPELPLSDHVRTALAQRIAVDTGGRWPRRIALVGPAGAGRTLAAAKLAAVHARASQNVCAVSLEQARRAFALAAVTEPFGVALETADDPSTVEVVRKRLKGYDVVVTDTPAVDLADRHSFARLGALLDALQPTEVVLVLPANAPADVSRLLLQELRAHVKVRSLLITHGDAARPRGAAVGLSLSERLPVSYLSDGPLAQTGIRPAGPDELARMVLP